MLHWEASSYHGNQITQPLPTLTGTECNSPRTRPCNLQITFVLLSGGIFGVQLSASERDVCLPQSNRVSRSTADSTNYIQPLSCTSLSVGQVKKNASTSRTEIKALVHAEDEKLIFCCIHREIEINLRTHCIEEVL